MILPLPAGPRSMTTRPFASVVAPPGPAHTERSTTGLPFTTETTVPVSDAQCSGGMSSSSFAERPGGTVTLPVREPRGPYVSHVYSPGATRGNVRVPSAELTLSTSHPGPRQPMSYSATGAPSFVTCTVSVPGAASAIVIVLPVSTSAFIPYDVSRGDSALITYLPRASLSITNLPSR